MNMNLMKAVQKAGAREKKIEERDGGGEVPKSMGCYSTFTMPRLAPAGERPSAGPRVIVLGINNGVGTNWYTVRLIDTEYV